MTNAVALTTTHPFDAWTIALYGVSGSGKSTLAAILAKYIFETSGLKTRWYLIDDGELPGEAGPLVEAGAIDVIDCRDVPHPFMAATNITKGMVPVTSGYDLAKDKTTGKWEAKSLDGYGLVVADSGMELAEKMFGALSQMSAANINVGGEGAWNFKDGSKSDWGEEVTIGSSNKAHYGIVQTRMKDFITRMGQLAKRQKVMTLITFGEDRGEQETTKTAKIGPKTKGGAQTTLIPGWFKFTFRTATKIDATGNKRILYTDGHKDGGVDALANRRFPVSVDLSKAGKDIQTGTYEPADIIKALIAYRDVTKRGVA